MAEARRQSEWQHTSHLLCLLVNIHRNPKRRAFSPSEFNLTIPRSRQYPSGTVDQLASAILGLGTSKGFLPRRSTS